MPRDSQRSKVYAAERSIGSGRQFADLGEVREYLEKITNTTFFRKLWFENRGVRIAEEPIQLRLKDGRGTSWARGGFSGYKRARCKECRCNCRGPKIPVAFLNLPKWARTEKTVLHELTHSVQNSATAAHGPEFCKAMLALTVRFMGREAGTALRTAYKEHRVKYIKKQGRPVSPERRAQLVAQLAVAREKKQLAAASKGEDLGV